MRPLRPVDTNATLKAPDSAANCVSLDVVRTEYEGEHVMCSLWEPDETERLALLAGLPIMLMVCGHLHPPVRMGVAREPDRVTGPPC